MIVSDFTKPELDYYRANCNFVGNEQQVFELRSQGISLEEIAENLNMSVEGIKRSAERSTTKYRGYFKDTKKALIVNGKCLFLLP